MNKHQFNNNNIENENRKDSTINNKDTWWDTLSIYKNPIGFLAWSLIELAWLYYIWDDIKFLSRRSPTIITITGWSVVLLLYVSIYSFWLYAKILADIWLRPENREKLIDFLKTTFKWSLLTYVFGGFYGYPTSLIINQVVYLFFFYYYSEKIYIRIFKKIDFIAESTKQRDYTRKNNKLLLLFPLWYLITSFTPEPLTFWISIIYITMFVLWYQRWPYDETYTMTNAEMGSKERLKLIKEAFDVVEEEDKDFTTSADKEFESEMEEFEEFELFDDEESLVESDEFEDYVELIDDVKEEEEEAYIEELKLERLQQKVKRQFFIDKSYPIHAYYLWWLMKDVPFYYIIYAFFGMLWDIVLFIVGGITLFCVIFLYFITYILPFSPELLKKFWAPIDISFIICAFCLYLLSELDKYKYYSDLAFFERWKAYKTYDPIHPYAMTGPTVDGPHTWQYWFFIIFRVFPSYSIILQQQLYNEEVRLAEIDLDLPQSYLDIFFEDGLFDIPVDINFWNPQDLYKLRKISPEVVRRFVNAIKDSGDFRKAYPELELDLKEWRRTAIRTPTIRFWRNYRI